ncbi:MAG: hypothetical protein ABW061_22290, partial [Polyangiaceae bacterium]
MIKYSMVSLSTVVCSVLVGAVLSGCSDSSSSSPGAGGDGSNAGLAGAPADGKDGQDGKDGLDGENGADGKDGLNGKDGADGADGKNGVDGKDGSNGTNGTNGTDGKDGTNGTDGANGTDGKDGEDGSDGKDAPVAGPAALFVSVPRAITSATSASFAFGCSAGTCSYQCSLDDAAFAACKSPVVVNDLTRADHKFSVKANLAGQDPGPVSTAQWHVRQPNILYIMADDLGYSD